MAEFGTAGAIAITYFLAARLGHALISPPSDLAVFWPASGIAAGIAIVLGRRALPALVVGVVIGTIAAGLLSDRRLVTTLFNGFWNAGEAVFAAWLLERWFGPFFTFCSLGRVAGFFAAANLATAAAAIGGAATMTLLHAYTTAPYWLVWREWFLSGWVGLVVVAPLVIGLAQAWRNPPSQKEWIEGLGVLGLTWSACLFTMGAKTGSWLSFSPGAFVLPLLLWLTARCQPTFAIAGAFLASAGIISATTFGIGRFGDAAVPITQRVAGAQVAMMTVTLFTLVLVALFTQRKEAEERLRESEGRLAKKNAALTRLHDIGSRLWRTRNLGRALDEILAGAIESLGADMGVIRILDTTRDVLMVGAHRGLPQEFLDSFGELPAASNSACGRALRSDERKVVDDVEAEALFAHLLPFARTAGYRAAQATPIIGHEGIPLGLLSTHYRTARQHTDQDLLLLDLYVRQAADIIERHRADDALRASEERLRLAQLKTGIGVWDRDLRTGKLTLTPELEAVLGLEPGSVKCYADFRDRVHPDDILAFEAERDAAVQRLETFRLEYRFIHPDGQVRWMLTTGGAFYDEVTGEPIRLVGNDADITERKIAEFALAERNAQLALAGTAALVGSFSYDIDSGKMQVSEGYVAIHGLRQGVTETTRREWQDRVHSEDVGRLDELRNQAFAERRREYYSQYRIVLPDSGARWIESRSFVSYDVKGNARHVVGVNIDVTERKQAELVLAERDAQLALAGKAARVGHFAYDLETGLVTVSEGYTAIHGLPERTTQMPIDQWRTKVHPDDLAKVDELRRKTFENRRRDYSFDCRIIWADGEVRWIDSRSFVLYDGEGQPRRIVGINIDITQRKQIEQALAERNAQLELANNIGRIGSFTIDYTAGVIRLSPGCATLYGLPEGTIELSPEEGWSFVHPEDLAGLDARRKQALQEQQREFVAQFRIVRADNGEVRWVEIRSIISYGEDGRPLHMVGACIDFTELRAGELHKSALIAELDHRVKNVLATILSVASRSRETSDSMVEFVAALEGRIQSMASTHELLSTRRWQGIPLAELVRLELAPYATASNTRIDGPDIVLRAEAGQALAMVFHELATNAAKFGAISTGSSGIVTVRWSVSRNERTESWLCIQWEESGGPPVVPPARLGYGTSVVRELIPYELGGNVDLTHLPDGVRCKLRIPGHWLGASNGEESVQSMCSGLVAGDRPEA
jgi:PAS domain S-box-containing protein